ncbi:MAG TPA: tetratricopeptide repeat protein [Prolixibacteraceae bacterium]|jgi:tetratricopeptide (TPR) repeat protein|nr:tetratricopeptide repeat protein [Prolixibacteraceae bacterium]
MTMRYLPLLFLLLLIPGRMTAQGDLPGEAGKYYASQDYARAAEMWEQVLASGKESAEIYYNLGNAYFKMGDHVRAILNYERARLLAPQNDDIAFNLTIANQSVVDRIEELPRPFFARWMTSLAQKASADGWARLSSATFLIFLILLGSYLFSRSALIKKVAFFMAIAAILLSLVSFFLARQNHIRLKNRTGAIIQCPRSTIKSSPSNTGTDLFLIHEGLKVEITDSLDSWKEIRLPDGNKGWLKDSCLVRI